MEYIRFENPPLSFEPKDLIIQKQENGWHFKIFADGDEIGLMLYRNGYGFANNPKFELTESDKSFLIEAASKIT